VRPKRKPAQQRRVEKNAAVTIFEDAAEDQELACHEVKGLGAKTLLSRPAQRMPTRPHRRTEKVEVRPGDDIAQGLQRLSTRPDDLVQGGVMEANGAAEEKSNKDPRRRTIFVPDDTTVLTIHPGANATDRLDDTFLLPNMLATQSATALGSKFEAEKPHRRARMSLAVAPKRIPLKQTMAHQGNIPSVDAVGLNGGKENLPPHAVDTRIESDNCKPVRAMVRATTTKPASSGSRLLKTTTASQARQAVHARKAVPMPRAQEFVQKNQVMGIQGVRSSSVLATSRLTQSLTPISAEKPPQDHQAIEETSRHHERKIGQAIQAKRQSPSNKPMLVGRRPMSKVSQYPVLAEDVAQPQLYEENWLSWQETALTELVNEIFALARSRPRTPSLSEERLRERMIDIYHRPNVTLLHQRLQASLLYGALCRPKGMPSTPEPARDIGLRKRFLSLWLDNYEENALRAAAEVVVGRQVPKTTGSLQQALDSSERILDPAKGRRALIGFLDTFFVSVEDADGAGSEDRDANGADERRWRKTVLRSLMLVWLLDQGKTGGAVSGCLFKRSSALKTSVSVLHALSSMLIPSIGDITRPLRHLDYTVDHVQDPLEEVKYHIDNIALDFRNGIFLARMVEILLFSSKQQPKESTDVDVTLTITLPDTTTLVSALYRSDDGSDCPNVLSQHLKLPCLGRAQKISNVQVALSALSGHSGPAGNLIGDITADDIVDGHREKTLALLWSLVSRHGLTQLIDWKDLITAIQRATGEDAAGTNAIDSQNDIEQLLLAWAAAHCARYGMQINNLTTAFADKRAYAAILDAYQDFLPLEMQVQKSAITSITCLESRLRAFGCSAAFVRHFATPEAIPSQTTTISNLAFLASRLLPLTRRHTAAVRLQRCFRKHRSRTLASQRISLVRMAHACATVVQTRNRLVAAALTLQRAWRSVLDARMSRLNLNVGRFQAVAKSWMSQRVITRSKISRCQSRQSLRVMGGW